MAPRETHGRIGRPTPLDPSLSPLPEFATACPASRRRRALTPGCGRSRSQDTVLLSRQSLDKGCSYERHALQTNSERSCNLRRGHRTGSAADCVCVRSIGSARRLSAAGSPAGAESISVGGTGPDDFMVEPFLDAERLLHGADRARNGSDRNRPLPHDLRRARKMCRAVGTERFEAASVKR
jgi:hypothetical protein